MPAAALRRTCSWKGRHSGVRSRRQRWWSEAPVAVTLPLSPRAKCSSQVSRQPKPVGPSARIRATWAVYPPPLAGDRLPVEGDAGDSVGRIGAADHRVGGSGLGALRMRHGREQQPGEDGGGGVEDGHGGQGQSARPIMWIGVPSAPLALCADGATPVRQAMNQAASPCPSLAGQVWEPLWECGKTARKPSGTAKPCRRRLAPSAAIPVESPPPFRIDFVS
jgi:hypothetical protein